MGNALIGNCQNMIIPHSKPTLGQDEAQAMLEVLRSGQLVQGPQCAAFERAIADLMGVRHGVAVSSGMSALHLAMLAMNIGEGDEVILSSYVCEALLDAVLHCRAKPVIVDVESGSGNINPAAVAGAITKKTRLIVAAHMFGMPAKVDELLATGIDVLEDCALSIGAKRSGRVVGSLGKAAIVSFHATKMLCTGEGGMICTSDENIAARASDLRDYTSRDDFRLRFNCKLTELAAAMGRAQSRKLADFIIRRRQIAKLYDSLLKDAPGLELPKAADGDEAAWYRYVVKLPASQRDVIRRRLAGEGIQCGLGVLHGLHWLMPEAAASCPVTDDWLARSLSLPIYPLLDDSQATLVANALVKALKSV